MSNLSLLDTTNASSSFSQSSVSGGGGAGIDLGIFSIGGSASASSYNAHSASSLAHSLSQHADSSSKHVELGTKAASSTSVGEVATRAHQQGESEDQFESASREFSNPNHCHAITFFFYRIDKCQTIRFELVSIDRRVDDPTSPTGVSLNAPKPATGVAVRSSLVLATANAVLMSPVARRPAWPWSRVIRQQSVLPLPPLGRHAVCRAGPIPEPAEAALAEVDKNWLLKVCSTRTVPNASPSRQSHGRSKSLCQRLACWSGCLMSQIYEPELEKRSL